MNENERKDVYKGVLAEQALNDDIIVTALTEIRTEARNQLFNSTPDEVEMREKCYMLDSAISLLESKLGAYIRRANGIRAEDDLREQEENDG